MLEAITLIFIVAAVATAMIYYLRPKVRWVASGSIVIVVNHIRFIKRDGTILNIAYNDGTNQKLDFKTEEYARVFMNKILKSFN